MKRNFKKIIFVVAGAVLLGIFVIRATNVKAPLEKKAPIPRVVVAQPQRMDIVYKLEYDGDVIPVLQANVFSRVSGLLEKLYTDMGKTVRADQLIALVDTSAAYQSELQTASTYYNTKAAAAREQDLFDKKLVSQMDLDNAIAAYRSAEANYNAAKVQLEYCKVRAPFRGYVTKRWLDPGSVVTSNPIVGNSNSTIYTVMDLDTVKIDVNVLDRDIAKIPTVKRAIATVDVVPGREYQAFVSRSAQAVTPTTRTMPVEILIPNRDQSIKPGEFARVTLVLGENPNAITVPCEAVLHDNQGTYVYITQNSTAVRRDVQTGMTQNDRLEILSGLDGSEQVIVVGQTFVKPNGKIAIVKNPPSTDTSHHYPSDSSSAANTN